MLRHLFSCLLLAAFCASIFSTQTAAQTSEQAQKTAVAFNKTETEAAPITSPETEAEKPAPKAPIVRVPAPRININRVGVDPGQTAPLSMTDAIRRALENNNDIEVARNDVRINETTLRSLEGIYDPVFTLTPTYSRNSRNGSGATNDFSLNGGALKRFEVGGGNITPFFNNNRNGTSFGTNSNGTVNQTSTGNGSFYSTQLGVTYNQPLLRNRSIDATRRGIRIQRKRLEQSDADFRQRTIETISQVQRAYWDLVFALRDQQNRVLNLQLTKENMRRVEAQIEAGAASRLARAEVATELANRESDVLLAAQNVTTFENTLKQLLLRDPNSPEWSQQLIPVDEPDFDTTPVKLEDSLAEAKTNRPELRRLNLQREINNIDVEFFKNQTKPRVDLNSTFSLNGFAQSIPGSAFGTSTFPLVSGDPRLNADSFLLQQINIIRNDPRLNLGNVPNIPTMTVTNNPDNTIGGYSRSLRNLFSSNAPNFTVGVTIEFPFRNKTAQADLAGAQIQQTRLDALTRDQEQNVIAEVRNAVQSVETARQRVLTARTAKENAEIQLQGEQKLFEVGRSTTFLLFQRENALANARNAEIRAETDYNKALAELQRATSTTLRANNVVIESFVP